MKHLTCACLLVALFVFGCKKDENNMGSANSTDKDFTAAASSDNFAEITIAQMAKTKASDSAIVRFADQIISDRVQTSAQLKDIASRLNIAASDTMSAVQAALQSQLNGLTGRDFDSVFVHSQVDSHDKAIVLYQNEINFGENGDLKNYASSTFPKLQASKNVADSLVVNY